MAHDKIIADRPPNDGRDWNCQCARCGSSVAFEDCPECSGHGVVDGPDGDEPCDTCAGEVNGGGYYACLSSAQHCGSHPLAGREAVARGTIEWFTCDEKPAEARHG